MLRLPLLLLLAAVAVAARPPHAPQQRRPIAAGWPFQPPAPPSPSPPPAPPSPPAPPECMWDEFHRSTNISAWEYQLAPRRHKVGGCWCLVGLVGF